MAAAVAAAGAAAAARSSRFGGSSLLLLLLLLDSMRARLGSLDRYPPAPKLERRGGAEKSTPQNWGAKAPKLKKGAGACGEFGVLSLGPKSGN